MIAFLIPTSNCIKRWKQAKKICSLTGNLKIDASEIFELESERKANWNQVQCLLFIFAPQYLLSKLMFEWEICFSLTQKAEERKVKAPAEGVGLNSSKAAAVFFWIYENRWSIKIFKTWQRREFLFRGGPSKSPREQALINRSCKILRRKIGVSNLRNELCKILLHNSQRSTFTGSNRNSKWLIDISYGTLRYARCHFVSLHSRYYKKNLDLFSLICILWYAKMCFRNLLSIISVRQIFM